MFYVIDFDTGCVESKSKTELPLLKYIAENKLELAVALVSSSEEICLKLSLREMGRVAHNLTDNINAYKGSLFNLIENNQRQIPTFTKKLGNRLIKESKKRCPDVRARKEIKLSQKKKATKQSTQRTTRKQNRKETSKLKLIFGKI